MSESQPSDDSAYQTAQAQLRSVGAMLGFDQGLIEILATPSAS